MRRVLFVLLALATLAGLTGCVQDQMYCQSPGQSMTCALPGSCAQCPETCQACGSSDPCNECGCGQACGGCGPQAIDPGPPTGAVTYPYYTLRGPRDFLARGPRPIGP